MLKAKEETAEISLPTRPRLRRLIFALASIFIVTGLLLSLLPYAIEKGAVSWLQQHGVHDARIDNVDLNLFSGEAVLEGLNSGDGLTIDHLRIDFDWLPLWHHIVHIRTLRLSESSLHLLEQKGIWQVAGIKPEPSEVASSAASDIDRNKQDVPWRVVVDDLVLDTVNVKVKAGLFTLSLPLKSLHLSLSDIQKQQQKLMNNIEIGVTAFSGFGYSVQIEGVKVAGEIAFSLLNGDVLASLKSKKLSLVLQGLNVQNMHDKRQLGAASVKLNGIALRGRDRLRVESLAVEKVHIKGAVKGQGVVKLASGNIHGIDAGLDGGIAVAKIGLKAFSAEGFAGKRRSLHIAETTLAGLSVPPADKSDGNAVQHIRIKSLDMKHIGLKAAMDDRGSVMLKHIKLASLNVGTDGSIALAKLALQQLKTEGLTADKRILHLEEGALAGLAIRPGKNIRLETLSLHKADLLGSDQSVPNARQLLGAFESASLEQLAIDGPDNGSFESLTFEGFQLPFAGEASLGSIGSIQASKAVMKKGGAYRLKQLKLDQLQMHLVKRKSGWLLPAEAGVGKPLSAAHAEETPQTPAAKPVSNTNKAQLVIDELVIASGSQIELHDESVNPSLKSKMQIEQFHFAPLDSSGKQRGKLNVKMKLGKSGALSLQGATNVAAGKQLRADLHVSLKNFDLPRLSGYVEADLGKSIKTGQFNLESDISIKNKHIDSKNKVLIRKLELDDSQHANKSGPEISLAGGMSVDMALGMLQDDRGDVELNVPVSGPLDNPDIKLNHIINKALLASLKTGALTYAALALQPYGTIILVADVATGLIKDAAKPTLTPIVFAERKAALSPQMNDYLTKIAALMKKKDFRLQVCGIATRIEGEQIIQPASETAEQAEKAIYAVEPALEDGQLLALAQKRTDRIIDVLHASGIAGEQLFNCRARIDESKAAAQPRVELLLDY